MPNKLPQSQPITSKNGSKYSDLESAFADKFDSDLPEVINAGHGIRVVASEIDDSTERIIRYLSETYGADINAACFQFFRTKDGRQLLVRTFTVAKEEAEANKQPGKRRSSEAVLLAMAKENKTEELIKICRQMSDVWYEQKTSTARGSFRYWTGKRMVYGVNVSGKLASAPPGQLDVWLRTDKLAEVTGVDERAIKEMFSKTPFAPFDAGKMDFVIRLKSPKEAELFIAELKALAQGQSKRSRAVV